ncbi:MAG: hypothetical protein A2X36_15135 [Elusimicrobia bacterium GWA2_69_24]|nr:MAG: hypothetical protein A2X36_15135 [Elusimicrobia bacterium GWA2_69_24]
MKRAALLLGGVLAALALAETGLGLMGWGYARRQRGGRATAAGPRILCVGDSFTFGMGAPRGGGYPEQLQDLLNKEPGDRRWVVLNAGVPSNNSSQVLKRLPALLVEEAPEILVVMTGWNDNNLTESNYWRVADLSRMPARERWRLRWRDLSGRWRTWRILSSAWARFFPPEKLPYDHWLFLDAMAEPAARRNLERLLDRSRRGGLSSRDWLAIGIFRHRLKDLDGARAAYGKAVASDPGNVEAHFRLGWVHHLDRDFAGFEAEMRETLRLDPRHDRARGMLGMRERNAPPARDWMEDLLSYDLSRILELAESRGVNTVFMTYPSPRHEVNGMLLRVFGRLGAEHPFHVVDNSALFGGLPKPEQYFSKDEPDVFVSHLNERGYGVMAGRLAQDLGDIGWAP